MFKNDVRFEEMADAGIIVEEISNRHRVWLVEWNLSDVGSEIETRSAENLTIKELISSIGCETYIGILVQEKES